MDGQQYLDQISGTTKPSSSGSKGNILSSKFVIVGLIGLVSLIIIVIIGALLGGGGKNDEKSLGYALKLHIANTSELIQEYQPSVRSSALRSYSASLYGIFSNTEKGLDEYLTAKYKLKEKDIAKSIVTFAEESKESLNNELFEAKINGALDRVFAYKMAYEISIVLTEEAKIVKITKNDDLKELLNKSIESLENLYDEFDDFSETN